MPVGASSGFNLYSPTFVRGLRADELPEMARAYGRSVNLAREAGFDAVEIHAGHGYLISQFPFSFYQPSEDEYGGSLQNRMRFMDMVMEEVMKAAGNDMAVLVKMNMRDGFKGGMELDETLQVAKTFGAVGRACVGVERRICKQGSDVCDAWRDAYTEHDALHGLLVAEVWCTHGRQVDDSQRAFSRGLFLGRCIEVPEGNQDAVGICRAVCIARENR